jgi:hypothetical protein
MGQGAGGTRSGSSWEVPLPACQVLADQALGPPGRKEWSWHCLGPVCLVAGDICFLKLYDWPSALTVPSLEALSESEREVLPAL